MGCCQASAPPSPKQEAAFKDVVKKEHHGGDSNYTLTHSLQNKQHPKSSSKYYESRKIKSSPSSDEGGALNDTEHATTAELARLKPQMSSSEDSPKHDYPKGKPLQYEAVNTTVIPSNSTSPATTHKSTLSPADAEKPSPKDNTLHLDEHKEREMSISKSRSRQFRARTEPASPDPDAAAQTASAAVNATHKQSMNEPPVIHDDDDDEEDEEHPVQQPRHSAHYPQQQTVIRHFDQDEADNASSQSDDMEIPVLLFSDSGDEEEEDEREAPPEEEDDGNLKIMQYLIEQENRKLEEEIIRMKSFVDEQETIKLKAEAFKEIQLEAKTNQTEDEEEEQKRKAFERFKKKQEQRQKQKEEAKQRHKQRKQEERKKKKKQEKLMKQKMKQKETERLKILKKDRLIKVKDKRKAKQKELAQSSNVNGVSRDKLTKMFERNFVKPFQQKRKQQTNEQKDSEEKDEFLGGQDCIDLSAFKAGLTTLGLIDSILSQSEVEMLFDHLVYFGDRDYGINATDFVYFLKQDPITFKEQELTTIQSKLLALGRSRFGVVDSGDDQETEQEPDDEETDELKNTHMPKMTITVSEPPENDENSNDTVNRKGTDSNDSIADRPISPTPDHQKAADIIRPMDTMHDDENAEVLSDDDDDDDDMDEDEPISMNKPDDNRRASISMSESMSMSMVSQTLPSNLPRQSFKLVSYNWNDSISQKSFNNYKKLKQRFASRYRHAPQKTRDKELINIQEKLLTKAINSNTQLPNPDGVLPEDEEIEQQPNNDNEEKQEEKQDDINADTQPPSQTQSQTQSTEQTANNNEPEAKKTASLGVTVTRSQLDDVDEDNELKDEHEKQRSAAASIKKIADYQGDEEMARLRDLYKKQFKMKQKLERLRKRSLLNFPAPPKPKDVDKYYDDHTKYITEELRSCICKNTRYTGLANFGPNGELGIEMEFTSDCDQDGWITGKRVVHFRRMKQAIGRGRIWMDVMWNGHKYVPCSRFEWTDEADGIVTKFEFNSVKHELDVDHSFFSGICWRYPSDLDPKKKSTKLIMHEGFFDFVCVSARRRTIRKNSFVQYHTLDVNEMNDDELEKVPKYVRRMSAYTEKIDQLYQQENPTTKEALFGDAMDVVAAIDERDPLTSDNSLPEQISE